MIHIAGFSGTDARSSSRASAVCDTLTPYDYGRSMSNTQRSIVAVLDKLGPLSHHGIIHALKATQQYTSPSGVRTRVSELVKQGAVVDSGQREYTPVGRKAILWRAV